MLFAEVVGVQVERYAERLGNGGVIRSGVSKNTVTLPDESFSQKLAEVTKPKYANLELLGLIKAVS